MMTWEEAELGCHSPSVRYQGHKRNRAERTPYEAEGNPASLESGERRGVKQAAASSSVSEFVDGEIAGPMI